MYMTRTLRGLEPADQDAQDALRKVKLGDVVKVDMVRPRNVRHHRRFFAMLHVVWQACGDWPSVDDLLTELKFRVGLVDRQRVVDRATGEVLAEIVKPQSISFAAMDEEAFRAFEDRCIKVICTDMVPGLDDAVLREEVMRAVA